jgi:hypothetical protein
MLKVQSYSRPLLYFEIGYTAGIMPPKTIMFYLTEITIKNVLTNL